MAKRQLALVGGLLAALGLGACDDSGGGDTQPPTQQPPPPQTVPFEPASPESYVAKVKNLLVGQPPTDAELQAVKADPKALAPLIDTWMAQPEFQAKSLAFFRNAFQQGQLPGLDPELNDLIPQRVFGDGPTLARLLQNIQESFPRTVWDLASQGRPLSEAVTTQRYMLTPPLMNLLAFMDIDQVDDQPNGATKVTDLLVQQNPKWSPTYVSAGPAIPLQDSLDPASPNYMKFYNQIPIPDMCKPDPANPQAPLTYKGNRSHVLFTYLLGDLPFPELPAGKQRPVACAVRYRGPSQWTADDFTNWRMVTIRAAKTGEQPTPFWDIISLRGASELVLRVPRVGFFGTPAFQANWMTNSSNQNRVTMNQTLIVALGKSFDASNSIVPVKETALAVEHAGPTTECYSCHRTLDPMRQFFRQAYSLEYHYQTDPTQTSTYGVFAFGDVTAEGKSLYELAGMLASHQRFGPAWAQKLCYWANSAACSEDDPEFQRIVAAFQGSKFDWKTLVRELLSSPITTAAAHTKTFDDRGQVVSISRRDHLCVALQNRLGVPDLCGVSGAAVLSANQKKNLALSNDLPADGYSRGSESPVLSNDPSLFFRDTTENLCRLIADQLIDAGMAPRYASARSADAIVDFVHNVMGLPAADARAGEVQQVLTEHLAQVKQQGLSATDSLKSTFVLACEAPSSIAIGL